MHFAGGVWLRLLPILFLGIVVATGALLIAGYGVAVGVGVLAGLILGLLAGTLIPPLIAHASRRSVESSGFYFSSDSQPPNAELISEMREVAELQGVDLGTIRSIVPVLRSADVGGVSLQLVAIEIHEAGLSMALDIRTAPGVLPPGPAARPALTDDAGTAYRAVAEGQGGLAGRLRYTVVAIPAPPGHATRLDVTIERFLDPFQDGRPDAVGPWTFSVTLPAGPITA